MKSRGTVKSSIRDWLLVLLYVLGIAGYPLVAPLPLMFEVDSRIVTVPFRGLFLAIALVVFLSMIRRRDTIYTGQFWWPYSIFWGIYIARLLVDTLISPIPLRLPVEEYYLLVFGLVLLPTNAFFSVLKPVANRSAIFATLVLSVLACLATYYLGIDTLVSGSVGRLGTETLNPISFGYLGATVVLLASFILLRLELRTHLGKVLLLGSIALGLLSVGLAGSRGPLAALVVTVLVLVGHAVRQTSMRHAAAFSLVLIASVVVALPYVVEMGSGIVERIEMTGTGLDPSDEDRFWLWRIAWAAFLDNPLLGNGIEPASVGFYPHNIVLEAYMATGFVGGCLLLFMLVYVGKRALDLLSLNPGYGWIGLLYIQQVVAAIFSGSIYGSTGVWYLMAAVVSAERTHRSLKAQRSRTQVDLPMNGRRPIGV